MNDATNGPQRLGAGQALTTGKANAIKSAEFSNAEKLAATSWQAVRELFPSQVQESDAALRIRLELLRDVILEVGPEMFTYAVRRVMSSAHSRHQVTVARIREYAGVPIQPPQSEAAKSFQKIMGMLVNHVQPTPEGRWVLEVKVKNFGGKPQWYEPPLLTENEAEALRAIGGWGALKAAYPDHIYAKWKDFQDFYVPSKQINP